MLPVEGYAGVIKIGGTGPWEGARNLFLLPSPPFAELEKLLPNAQIEFDPGITPAEAALVAKRSDVVIAFGIRVEGEGFDMADLSLPWGQDAVIDAVAEANPNTLVVLETGNPVSAVAPPSRSDGAARTSAAVDRSGTAVEARDQRPASPKVITC